MLKTSVKLDCGDQQDIDNQQPAVMAEIQSDSSTEMAKDEIRGTRALDDSATEKDIELGEQKEESERPENTDELDWENAPENPNNWPAYKKLLQVIMLSAGALLA